MGLENIVIFKGYPRYKTITSQNVSSEGQIKIIFNHPMIYRICDVTMSISTWDQVHFWVYLLNYNSWSYQTWPIDRYKQRQEFSEIFWIIWRTGVRFQVLFHSGTCPNYSITNYVKIPGFYFFEKMSKGQLKMVNANH